MFGFLRDRSRRRYLRDRSETNHRAAFFRAGLGKAAHKYFPEGIVAHPENGNLV